MGFSWGMNPESLIIFMAKPVAEVFCAPVFARRCLWAFCSAAFNGMHLRIMAQYDALGVNGVSGRLRIEFDTDLEIGAPRGGTP